MLLVSAFKLVAEGNWLFFFKGLTVGLSENDYSGSAVDGYIVASIDRSDTVSSTVTLRVTPMTYAEYSTRYSALVIPPGCYEARSKSLHRMHVLFISYIGI